MNGRFVTMGGRGMMSRARVALLVGLIFAGGAIAVARVADADAAEWKGAETFAPATIGPNTDRCGAFPRHVEAQFAGSGIDTEGGPFAVTASGCLDTEANTLSEMEATDRYLGSGHSLRIIPGDTALDVDPATCTATTVEPVPFEVAGGTGKYAGATGSGTYELVFTLPTCAGPQHAVHVWFHGELETAPAA